MNKLIKMDGKEIGKNRPVYIIAEMSGNHLMDYERAKKIIYMLKDSGVDAVKLQTYTPDTITINSNRPEFMATSSLWKGESLYSLYEKAYTPWEWQKDLMEYANELGMTCFSSPFDVTAVDFMEKIGMPAYKIASYEINDIILLKKVAKTGKPVIISTGIAHLEDIERALNVCTQEGNENVILLKCTSAYPAPYEDMNLKTIPLMENTFDCIVGLSDHTLGSEVALGGVTLGACVVEKHVTIAREDGGPDAAFSMEINEFTDMVKQIRNLEKALGTATFKLTDKQEEGRAGSRSLYVVKNMKKGDVFDESNVKSIRPGYGMHTMYYEDIIGKCARRDIEKGTPMSWDLIL